jgi:hypothetical protein
VTYSILSILIEIRISDTSIGLTLVSVGCAIFLNDIGTFFFKYNKSVILASNLKILDILLLTVYWIVPVAIKTELS